MTKLFRVVATLALLTGTAVWAQSSQPKTIAQILNNSVSGVENELVPAVEAMPEEKFSFVPTSGEFKGARDFATQAKHIAHVNYLIAAGLLGEKPPVDIGEDNGPATMTSKADIVNFLKGSFAYSHKAIGTFTEKNVAADMASPFGEGRTTRLAMAVLIVGHSFDHYGQIVEYLRMNGIIPPASRQ
jgi:uncharacterized damage-inducible protein DinB